MALIEIKHLEFRYPDEQDQTLADLSIAIAPGEFVVLCGPSGSGKTTLLRHLKCELTPVGLSTGCVLYKGKPMAEHPTAKLAKEIGLVGQDPDNQMVMERVQQELAFSLENVGTGTETMRRRISELAHFFGLEPLLHQRTEELSGGQKQIINLASVLLLQPEVLLLDEPTAQLDPIAAREFLQLVYRLNQELAMTVIISEHRLEEIFPLADRIIMLEKGKVRFSGAPREVISEIWQTGSANLYEYLPSLSRLYLQFEHGERRTVDRALPLAVKEGRSWLAALRQNQEVAQHKAQQQVTGTKPSGEPVLNCRNVSFQYERGEPPVLNGLSLQISDQEILALMGGNGSGKSTLLRIMLHLLSPQRGEVLFKGSKLQKLGEKERYRRIGYLPQNPLAFFAHDTVYAELVHAAKRIEGSNSQEEVAQMVDRLQLKRLLERHPYDLSGGEKQLVALACVLLAGPELLVLDEPTKGIDPGTKMQLADHLKQLNREGLTICIATHDLEFAAAHATRCALLFDGAIAAVGEPAEFFSGNYFYTTAINRLVRDILPKALTCEDVLKAWKR